MNFPLASQPVRANGGLTLTGAMRQLDQAEEGRAAQELVTVSPDRMQPLDLDSSFKGYRMLARGEAPVCVLEADQNRLSAREPGTGEVLWTHQSQPDFYHTRFAVSPGGELVAALDQNPMTIQILDGVSGQPEASLAVAPSGSWFTNRTAMEFSPSGRLLATFENGAGTTLMAFQPGSEEPTWTASLGSGVDAYGAKISSSSDDSLVVVGLGSQAVGVDGQTGAVLWRKEQPRILSGRAPALVADGRVYAVESGCLAARSGQTGDVLWSGTPPQDPVVAQSDFSAVRETNELRNLTPVRGPGDLIYTLQGNGELVAFKLDGQMAWHAPLPPGAQWPPAVSQKSLIVVTTTPGYSNHESTLHILDAQRGLRWADSNPMPGRVRLGLTTTSDGRTHLGLSQGLVSLDELETVLEKRRESEPEAGPAAVQVQNGALVVGGVRLAVKSRGTK